MTKAELVNTISNKLGTEKNETQKVVEAFMQEIRTSMYNGDNVYLRGFGSFIIKTRAAKTGRNISRMMFEMSKLMKQNEEKIKRDIEDLQMYD